MARGDKSKCAGTKEDGQPCSYGAQPGSTFCKIHQGQATGSALPARSGATSKHKSSDAPAGEQATCAGTKRNGEPCTYKAKPDSPYCDVHRTQAAGRATEQVGKHHNEEPLRNAEDTLDDSKEPTSAPGYIYVARVRGVLPNALHLAPVPLAVSSTTFALAC